MGERVGEEGQDEAVRDRGLMALPGRTLDATAEFHACLVELVRLVGGEAPGGQGPGWEWEVEVRAAVREGLVQAGGSARLFEVLVRAAVLDPNPSFNRQFVEPAVAVFGRREVQAALIRYLRTGTDQERAGAARAWYWAQAGLVYRGQENYEKGIATPESRAEYDAVADLRAEWGEATLREFVANDDLDVRRCILPGLSLKPEKYPEELRGLVAEAVHIARTHPDEYLRHRVEHQV